MGIRRDRGRFESTRAARKFISRVQYTWPCSMLLSSCYCQRALFPVVPFSSSGAKDNNLTSRCPATHINYIIIESRLSLDIPVSIFSIFSTLIYTSVHSSDRSPRDHQAQVCDRTRNDIISCLSTQYGNSGCTASIKIAMVAQQGPATSQADF